MASRCIYCKHAIELHAGGSCVGVDDWDCTCRCSAPTSIEVVATHALAVEGAPLSGTCSSCGADLDALARTGVTGHVCFGPGDSTNHREPS
jgi:hypothetical protein